MQEVHDMLTSLSKSLEQESDEITGLLLQEIGYERNGKNVENHSVHWSVLAHACRYSVAQTCSVVLHSLY